MRVYRVQLFNAVDDTAVYIMATNEYIARVTAADKNPGWHVGDVVELLNEVNEYD